jgi:hypothetical protein
MAQGPAPRRDGVERPAQAAPLCGRIAGLTSMGDLADRAPRVMANGELLCLERRGGALLRDLAGCLAAQGA